MSSGYESGGSSDHEVCNVFCGSDLIVTSGVNAGDGVTNASDSFLGDIYLYSNSPTPYDLVVHDSGVGRGNSANELEDNVNGQNVGEGSEIGSLGDGLELESRLTFMGSDGSTVEVLIINNTDISAQPPGRASISCRLIH